jgi:hypothetical protein
VRGPENWRPNEDGSGHWIAEENPVPAVDAFVDELDLTKVGFEGAEPAATRGPAYHPATHC